MTTRIYATPAVKGLNSLYSTSYVVTMIHSCDVNIVAFSHHSTRRTCRVVLSEAANGCICFTRKIQHGGDWEVIPKNVHNFLMPVRPLSLACGHGIEMLLIIKNLFLTWSLPGDFRYDSPKKCPTILYAVNLWPKPVSATGANVDLLSIKKIIR